MESKYAPPITEFDKITTNNSTLMIKALIPFMEPQMQKSLSIMIRMQEFQQTLTYFNSPFHQMSCSSTPDEMMDTLLCYCPPNTRDMISNIKNVMQMSNAFKMYSDFEQNPAFQDMFNQMNNVFHNEESQEGQSNQSFGNDSESADDSADKMEDPTNPKNMQNSDSQYESVEYEHAGSEHSKEDTSPKTKTGEKNNIMNLLKSGNSMNIPQSLSEADKMLGSFMNQEQKEKYEEFMKQLNDITF